MEETFDLPGTGEEFVISQVRKAPDQPTGGYIRGHNIDHGVFRAWCPHCVHGRAEAYGHHLANMREQARLPTVTIDCVFMSSKQEREEERGMPILVVKDDSTILGWAHVVPKKGRDRMPYKY